METKDFVKPVGERWYAAFTKHQHEKRVTQVLTNKGFETFLPLYREVHRWKDRDKTLCLPLFPCYVFVRTNLERKLDILQTPGICWLVGRGGYAWPIPDHEVDPIRSLAGSSAKFEPHPFVACGDRVRVRSGPLLGIEGIIIRARNQHRLVLSVQLLKQSAAVEVDLSDVERVSAEPRNQAWSV